MRPVLVSDVNNLGLPQHDLHGRFDLYRSRSSLRGDNGMDRASLDPKAVLAQKPERPALHHRCYGTACQCGNWRHGCFANRGSVWLCMVGEVVAVLSENSIHGFHRS